MLKNLIKSAGEEKRGSTLILVLIFLAVFMLLGAAAMTVCTVSTSVTENHINKQQADLITQSAAKSAVAYILKDSSVQSSLSSLAVNGTSSGTTTFNGELYKNSSPVKCNIAVLKQSSTVYKVTAALTDYNGVSSTAVAYLTQTVSSGTVENPFSNLFYSTGKGTFNFQSNTDIYGDIYTQGVFDLNNSANIYNNIYAAGGFIGDNGGAKVYGSVYTNGTAICNQDTQMNSLTAQSFQKGKSGKFTVNSFVKLGDNSDTSAISCSNIQKNQTIAQLNIPTDFTGTINSISSYLSGLDLTKAITITGNPTINSQRLPL